MWGLDLLSQLQPHLTSGAADPEQAQLSLATGSQPAPTRDAGGASPLPPDPVKVPPDRPSATVAPQEEGGARDRWYLLSWEAMPAGARPGSREKPGASGSQVTRLLLQKHRPKSPPPGCPI